MPPHLGHVHLCRVAESLCDKLTILVCSLPDDLIAGTLRHEWMRVLFPNADVIHHDKVVPQEPSEHPDFWPIWRQICRTAVPKQIDLVFGSEEYVIRLAAEVGGQPVLVDPERSAAPISATIIRQAPYQNWNMIPGVVRPYFQKRIVLFGCESTGKTTLAGQLGQTFNTSVVPEYGRVHDQVRAGAAWSHDDFDTIRLRQGALSRSVARFAGPLVIEDTDPLLTDVWQAMLMEQELPTNTTYPLADLYLFLEADIDWQDDGTRYFSSAKDRIRFQDLCKEHLAKLNASYLQVSGFGEDRLKAAIMAIENTFPEVCQAKKV